VFSRLKGTPSATQSAHLGCTGADPSFRSSFRVQLNGSWRDVPFHPLCAAGLFRCPHWETKSVSALHRCLQLPRSHITRGEPPRAPQLVLRARRCTWGRPVTNKGAEVTARAAFSLPSDILKSPIIKLTNQFRIKLIHNNILQFFLRNERTVMDCEFKI